MANRSEATAKIREARKATAKTLAANLIRLLAYAKDHPDWKKPATKVDLVAASGVSRSTLYRLLPPADLAGMRDWEEGLADLNVTLAHVTELAMAYGLQTYELLHPRLNPAAPPAEWEETALEALATRASRDVQLLQLFGGGNGKHGREGGGSANGDGNNSL